MIPIHQAAAEFLSAERIAVTGVSRDPGSHGANVIYDRLKQRGYTVFAVNPNAATIGGDPAYRSLSAIPGGVEAVVISTRPERALSTMREAAELGITTVWMHRSIDGGSVSADAADFGRAHGIRVISGGCPLMFAPASDPGHTMLRGLCRLSGRLPRAVA